MLSMWFGLKPAIEDGDIFTMCVIPLSLLISGMSVPSKGIPSNTHNEVYAVPFNEAVTTNTEYVPGAPGAPEVVVTATPAICPANA